MKKLLLLTKTILVAALLGVGTSASWAFKKEVTTTKFYLYNEEGSASRGDLTEAQKTQTSDIFEIVLGKAGTTWSVGSNGNSRRNVFTTSEALTVTDEVPTAGVFYTIKPKVNGYITIDGTYYSQKYYYLAAKSGDAYTKALTVRYGSGNYYGSRLWEYELQANETYYVYGATNDLYMHNITFRSTGAQKLYNEIATATSLKATEGYTEGQDALESAITTAQGVLDNSTSTDSECAAAQIVLIEAEELFSALNTQNTTYSVTSSSRMSDGANVKSVYGITMTYHGTWSWSTARLNGCASAATDGNTNLTNNIPTAGEYWVFTPTVDGSLTIKAAFYARINFHLVDGENGNKVSTYYQGANTHHYGEYNFGTIKAGRTYYFYKADTGNGYQLGGFTFTPAENNRSSYTACNGEIIKGGSTINSVAGITMTYGGTSEDIWSFATDRVGAYLSDDATVTGKTPTGNTFMIFNPSVNGILTINCYFFLGNGNCHLYLTNGTDVEDQGYSKGSGSNGSYTKTLSTILKAGDTYYVYFADGYGTARFQGFTFTPVTTVSATIGGTGFATFSSEYPLDFSTTTTKAYTASLTEDNTVLLTPVTAIPANTGILLKGATEDIPVKAGFFDYSATNLLKASADVDIAASTEGTYHYVLANGTKGVGFYNLAANKNIGTGKAYLETTTSLAAASEARLAWTFADEGTNGINTIRSKETNANEFYNLNGQRVSQPNKGLYIVNGKKIIIR